MADHVDFIIRYESGMCESDQEMIDGFQDLLDKGILFNLQGHYGRVGSKLLEMGLIERN